jgi:hypothetical protein
MLIHYRVWVVLNRRPKDIGENCIFVRLLNQLKSINVVVDLRAPLLDLVVVLQAMMLISPVLTVALLAMVILAVVQVALRPKAAGETILPEMENQGEVTEDLKKNIAQLAWHCRRAQLLDSTTTYPLSISSFVSYLLLSLWFTLVSLQVSYRMCPPKNLCLLMPFECWTLSRCCPLAHSDYSWWLIVTFISIP